eukprot:4257257-Ditylum_brightwellii.AAC.1
MADHRTSVPLLAENNLTLACYFIKHKMERVSRTITMEDMTLEKVQALNNLKIQDEDYDKPKKGDYSTTKKKNWSDTFGSLNEVITKFN